MRHPVDLSIAYSADGYDAFHYWALQTGRLASTDFEVSVHIGAIDELDAAAAERRYQVSTISALAYPHLADDYRILGVGACVERGEGPMLVSRHYHHPAQLQFRRVGVASLTGMDGLLARWACPDAELIELDAQSIGQAVAAGQVDAGVLAAGRLPAGGELHTIAALGTLWRRQTGLPLPLRLKIVDRRLDIESAGRVCDMLRGSLRLALEHRAEALLFAAAFPGEHSDEQLTRSAMRDGLAMADDVRMALGLMFSLAKTGAQPAALPDIEIVDGATAGSLVELPTA
ncbi:MAG TPA: MqnA/MqnD/SBP family protein [Pirellulales bacterium]|jgi:predicted solute-binding protein|nr:MqnA/MqnD/SBP family protein [Pirellulales bacterium]